ncbi:hypothetical protein Chor_015624 [Crotalus horridus]
MGWMVSVSILFLSILIIMLLSKMGNPWKKNSKDFPPGPRPLPVIGNLHIMDLKKPYQTMLELSKQYGPVFKIQLGLQKIVVLTGYETIKEALVNKADVFAERARVPIFEEFSRGFGIVFSHGKNWRVMRRFMLTTLRDYGMGKRSMEIRIAEECSFLVKKFESYKGELVFLLEFKNLSILCYFEGIEERKTQNNGYFHHKNLEESVMNIFVAGVDTVSGTLFWAFTLMMKYPLIQSKCFTIFQEEITNVVGYAQPRTEHRTKMPYTDAVVHEVQRYAHVIPLNLPHETTVDGTHVVPLLTSVLHDESQWERLHEFYPEHFLNTEGKFVKRDVFMPFSAGRRVCPGETLAKTEIFMFFTSLLQKFILQPAPGLSKEDLDMTRAVGLTTPPNTYTLCALPCS